MVLIYGAKATISPLVFSAGSLKEIETLLWSTFLSLISIFSFLCNAVAVTEGC